MSTALTIGMFDGVHLGHLTLIERARQLVGSAVDSGRVVVVTFDPSPAAVLRPDQAPPRLISSRARTRLLEGAGVDVIEVLRPTPHLLQMPPEAFLDTLLERFSPTHIVEGGDFRFGHRRQGDMECLARIGRARGFEVSPIDDVEALLLDKTRAPARSSVIRQLIARGRVADAARLLGRPWSIEGTVVEGEHRGRSIGCPTANLDTDGRQLPADGVYAGVATLPDGSQCLAALSVGTNPTFEGCVRTCEAHLLGFDGTVGDYGWTLEVAMTRWLRDQLRFDGIEALKEAIDRDLVQVAAAYG